MRLLLDKDAEVNVRDKSLSTPLHDAIKFGSGIEVVRLLLNRGAGRVLINARNKESKTPLQIALVMNRNEELVRLLLANGADVNLNDQRFTPLHDAIKFEYSSKTVRLLLDKVNKVYLRKFRHRKFLAIRNTQRSEKKCQTNKN